LEAAFRFLGAPGGSSFMEKVIVGERLSPEKAPNEFRIFTYGESTMHGSQYGPTASPARWLGMYLKDYLPDKKIEVTNFARIGRGSEFTYDTFKQTLFYKPDLAIFYLGHNDFLFGNRKDHIESKKKGFAYQLKKLIKKSFFLSTIKRFFIKKRMERKQKVTDDKIEYDIIETPPQGIGQENAVLRDEPLYLENVTFFKKNIERIIKLARKKNIPVIFLIPVSNLKDFAPFYSYHLKKLSDSELSSWEKYYEAGKLDQAEGRYASSFENFKKAMALDDTYSDLLFRLGQLYFRKGDLIKAKQLFERSKDNDGIIFRAPREITAILKGLNGEGVFVLDTEKMLSPEAPGGIMGEPIIEDNAHFSLKGQALVGKGMAYYIADKGLILPEESWQFNNERAFNEMLDELGIDNDFMFNVYLKMVNYFGSRYDNRVRFAKKALQIKPNGVRALRYLAWTYWLMGKPEEAARLYERIRVANPKAFNEITERYPEIKEALEK